MQQIKQWETNKTIGRSDRECQTNAHWEWAHQIIIFQTRKWNISVNWLKLYWISMCCVHLFLMVILKRAHGHQHAVGTKKTITQLFRICPPSWNEMLEKKRIQILRVIPLDCICAAALANSWLWAALSSHISESSRIESYNDYSKVNRFSFAPPNNSCFNGEWPGFESSPIANYLQPQQQSAPQFLIVRKKQRDRPTNCEFLI